MWRSLDSRFFSSDSKSVSFPFWRSFYVDFFFLFFVHISTAPKPRSALAMKELFAFHNWLSCQSSSPTEERAAKPEKSIKVNFERGNKSINQPKSIYNSVFPTFFFQTWKLSPRFPPSWKQYARISRIFVLEKESVDEGGPGQLLVHLSPSEQIQIFLLFHVKTHREHSLRSCDRSSISHLTQEEREFSHFSIHLIAPCTTNCRLFLSSPLFLSGVNTENE